MPKSVWTKLKGNNIISYKHRKYDYKQSFKFFKGITNGDLSISEGYIAKLQKQVAQKIKPFKDNLYKRLVQQELIYWDDTVVFVSKKRTCFRFYGNEGISYYTAHERKNLEGIIEDGVLTALKSNTKVEHDHNKVNYNEVFSFQNIECVQHLMRDLQKAADDTKIEEVRELKEFISQTIKERTEHISKGLEQFSKEYLNQFKEKLCEFVSKIEGICKEKIKTYGVSFVNTLIKRIKEYKENYFAWVYDFKLPTTNNLSERALRPIKSKMKISAQFQNIKSAKCFANLKTYIET